MALKSKAYIFILLCIISFSVSAQEDSSQQLKMGDSAPPLRVRSWLKGTPVTGFEKGKIYVVDFWATWCRPCKAAMPRFSTLARRYQNKATFLAIDVYEKKSTSLTAIKAFVDGMGHQMDFAVAMQDSDYMAHDWVDASGEHSIPSTFVVNAEGKIAWMGHPKNVEVVLSKVINNTWDINEELSKRNLNKYLSEIDSATIHKLPKYLGDYEKLDDLGKPDSILLRINEVVKQEPKLKYAPSIASFTFTALLRTDTHQAYEYGKEAIMTSTYDEAPYREIISAIKDDLRKITLPPEIYRLGAECYQMEIDRATYPELLDMPKLHIEMAAWYELAGDKTKAMEAKQKAIKFNNKVHKNWFMNILSKVLNWRRNLIDF